MKIIKTIRQNGEPTAIGADQFCISPLSGTTGAENLEEQYLLGTDCSYYEFIEDGVKKIEKNFGNNNYRLYIEDYSNKPGGVLETIYKETLEQTPLGTYKDGVLEFDGKYSFGDYVTIDEKKSELIYKSFGLVKKEELYYNNTLLKEKNVYRYEFIVPDSSQGIYYYKEALVPEPPTSSRGPIGAGPSAF